MFVTNEPRRSRAALAERLTEIGIPAAIAPSHRLIARRCDLSAWNTAWPLEGNTPESPNRAAVYISRRCARIPLQSGGTARSRAPISVSTVLPVVPLRLLPLPRPAGGACHNPGGRSSPQPAPAPAPPWSPGTAGRPGRAAPRPRPGPCPAADRPAPHPPPDAGQAGRHHACRAPSQCRALRVLPRAAFPAAHRQATSLTQPVRHAQILPWRQLLAGHGSRGAQIDLCASTEARGEGLAAPDRWFAPPPCRGDSCRAFVRWSANQMISRRSGWACRTRR